MCVGLVLLAHSTAFNIFLHMLCKTQSPELSRNKLMGLEVSCMTGSFMVMILGEDGVAEQVIRGDIDMAFVCQDMVIVLPIQEARLEDSRDILQGRL